jgi:hypothetical protein
MVCRALLLMVFTNYQGDFSFVSINGLTFPSFSTVRRKGAGRRETKEEEGGEKIIRAVDSFTYTRI